MPLPHTDPERDWTRERDGLGPGSGVEMYAPHVKDELDRLYENDEYLEGLLDSITTDAVTLSGTQTITGAKTFSAAANFDAAADFDGAVDMSAGLTVSGGTPAFSTEIQANAGINIASGQRVEHNGTPVSGYLADGTPYFTLRFTGTIANSATSLVIAHGIAGNPATNNKLFPPSTSWKVSTTYQTGYSSGASSLGNLIDFTNVDDTNITLSRTTGGAALSVCVELSYVL